MIFWTNQSLAVDAAQAEMHCYNPEQMQKLAEGLTDLKKCKIALAEKDHLIQESLMRFDDTGPAWWQEPSFVVGGMVVSVSVTALVTYLIVRK